MASEDEALAKLRAWRTSKHRKGTDTELLTTTTTTSRPTKLFILSGYRFESSKAFRAGDFSIRIIQLLGNPVSMVTCMVGDHLWMLAKDSATIRVSDRSFVFAFPGVLYGLALPAEVRLEGRCVALEEIFARFCAYHDLVGKDESTADHPNVEISGNWTRAYSKILDLATRTNTKIAVTATATAVIPIESPSLEKIQRAIRMSAAIKLASRALLNGTLIPNDHLHMSVASGSAHAYPTMWAVADVLDTIQNGRPPARGDRAPAKGFWAFKDEGLVMLLDVVKAYEVFVTGRKRLRAEEGEEEGKRREVRAGTSPCGGGGVGDAAAELEVKKRVGACGKSY